MKFILFFIGVFQICSSMAYRMYYVEDECTSRKDEQKIVYNVPAQGPNSVGEMRSNRFGTYSRTGRSCLIKLKPPEGYGIVVTVKKVDFRNHEPCEDFIKIYTQKSDEGYKICSFLNASEKGNQGNTFFSQGTMEILYHTEDGGFGFNDGFRLIFTVAQNTAENECNYENQFKCSNSRCIWAGVTCDGHNNCGDDSDESTFGKAKCSAVFPITIAVILLAVAAFLALSIAICLCFCRTRQQAAEKNRLYTDFPSRPNGGYLPLPGYTYDAAREPREHSVNIKPHIYQNTYIPCPNPIPQGSTYQSAQRAKRTNQFQEFYPQQSPLDLPPPYKP